MTGGKRPRSPDDEDIVFLDETGAEDVARALAEAEAAVAAVQDKHRHAPVAPPPEPERDLEHARPSEAASDDALRRAEAIRTLAMAEADALRGEVEAARGRVAAAEEEAAKLRESLVRKVADFENLKRRTDREKSDYFKFALSEVFRDLLAVLDNFERAMAQPPAGEPDDFRVGVEMIGRQLGETLRRYGLAEVPALGQSFDPTVHEAVLREETAAAAPGTVLDVFQKGYLLNERLLRPALVKVAAAPPAVAPPAG